MARASARRRALRQVRIAASGTDNGATITVPSDVQKGDLILFNQYSRGAISQPTDVAPAGYDQIYTTPSSGPWMRAGSYVRLADGSEGGSTITGIDATTSDDFKTVAVIRGNRPFKSYRLLAAATVESVDTDPADQVVGTSALKQPGIVVANYGSNSAISPRTMSPAADVELSPSTNFYTAIKIMAGDYADVSVAMDDEGNNNHLASYCIIPSIYDNDQANTASLENSSSSSTSSVNTPSTVSPGDALFLFDRASNASGSGPASSPDSGWSELATVTGNPHRFSIYGKIAAEGDASLSVAGATGNTTNHHVVLSFRGDRPFQKMTAFSPVSVAPVSTDPADIVVTDQSKDKLRLHLASYSASAAVSPRTMSPAKDGEVSPATVFYAAYRILAAGAALGDTTVGMDDEGTGNTLLAVGVELT